MKFLIFLLALVGLSSQLKSFEQSLSFPIKAVSVIRGETKDPITNQLWKIRGIVHFTQESLTSKVAITVDISGLPTYTGNAIVKKGFHVHTYGISDYSDNITAICTSTGPHWNPTNSTHGFLDAEIRHDGDLGNLLVSPDGTIKTNLVDDRLTLFGENSIIGRSLVLHSNEDDGGLAGTEMSRGFGSSGPRIACGVIGLEKSEMKSVSRSSFGIVTGQEIPVVQYLSVEEPSVNATNVTSSGDQDDTDVEIDFESLDDLNKSFPQAVPIFKMFYKIIENVVASTRESNIQLLNALSQLQLNPVLEITATLPENFTATAEDDIQTTTPQPTTIINQL